MTKIYAVEYQYFEHWIEGDVLYTNKTEAEEALEKLLEGESKHMQDRYSIAEYELV